MKAHAIIIYYKKLKWMDNTKEMEDLVIAAGYEVVSELSFRKLHKDNYLTETKYEQLDYLMEEHNIKYVIINEPVSLKYMRKLEAHFDSDEITILDKAMLTLEIFDLKASSPEIKAQIKLAQMKYTMPRMRQELGVSLRTEKQARERGTGQTAKEIMQSDSRRKRSLMEKKIDDFRSEEVDSQFYTVPRIPILGFYSVGKSTLFNILTDNERETSSDAFTTMFLKTSWSRVTGYPIQLVDTIGLVDLPPQIIESFSLMLTSIFVSDIIVICVDASIESTDFDLQLKAVLGYYERFAKDGREYRIIFALTKCDLTNEDSYQEYSEKIVKMVEDDELKCSFFEVIGIRMDRPEYVKKIFSRTMDMMLDEDLEEVEFTDINPSDRSKIFDHARIIDEGWKDGKQNIKALLPKKSYEKNLSYINKKEKKYSDQLEFD